MKKSTRFGIDVGWVFFSSVLTFPLGFILSIILARFLGAHDLGLYRIAITIYGIVTIIAIFGIPSSLIKFIAEIKEDKEKLHQMASCGFVNAFILGLIVSTVVFLSSGLLANIFNIPELEKLLKILAILFPFASFYSVQDGLLTGLRKMRRYTVLSVTRNVLTCISIGFFVFLGFGVEGAIYGMLFSSIAACLIGFFLLKKYINLNLKNYLSNTKKILSFGSQVFTANAINKVNYHADIILIGYLLTPVQVGYYSVAIGLTRFFWIIPQSIQKISYPIISEFWKEKSPSMSRLIDKNIKYSISILLPMGLGVGLFSKQIITIIYGEQFIHAVLPFLVLLVGTIILGIVKSIGGSLPGVGRPDLAVKKVGVSALLNVFLNVLLIPQYGILGAAIATTCSFTVEAVLHLFFTLKLTKIKVDFNWHIQIGLVFVSLALFSVFLGQYSYYPVAIVVCVFPVIIWHYFLSKEDKKYFFELKLQLFQRFF